MAPLRGFLFPRSATGVASLLPPPPWHYSGDMLTIENVKLDDYEPLRKEIESFVECVREGKEPVVPGEDAVRAVGTATAILKSIEEHLVAAKLK